MTNQEILEKAIQKAIDGGWTPLDDFSDHFELITDVDKEVLAVRFYKTKGGSFIEGTPILTYTIRELLFTHDVAKALWGEEMADDCPGCGTGAYTGDVWQYHLQQMVIAEDPIKYLGDNL